MYGLMWLFDIVNIGCFCVLMILMCSFISVELMWICCLNWCSVGLVLIVVISLICRLCRCVCLSWFCVFWVCDWEFLLFVFVRCLVSEVVLLVWCSVLVLMFDRLWLLLLMMFEFCELWLLLLRIVVFSGMLKYLVIFFSCIGVIEFSSYISRKNVIIVVMKFVYVSFYVLLWWFFFVGVICLMMIVWFLFLFIGCFVLFCFYVVYVFFEFGEWWVFGWE